jgi:hypothetical protein
MMSRPSTVPATTTKCGVIPYQVPSEISKYESAEGSPIKRNDDRCGRMTAIAWWAMWASSHRPRHLVTAPQHTEGVGATATIARPFLECQTSVVADFDLFVGCFGLKVVAVVTSVALMGMAMAATEQVEVLLDWQEL